MQRKDESLSTVMLPQGRQYVNRSYTDFCPNAVALWHDLNRPWK
jgi:hypothetical protein